jgi:hypothetical protein
MRDHPGVLGLRGGRPGAHARPRARPCQIDRAVPKHLNRMPSLSGIEHEGLVSGPKGATFVPSVRSTTTESYAHVPTSRSWLICDWPIALPEGEATMCD